MNRKKFEGGLWHHRVPDFKLVFCGGNSQEREASAEGAEWALGTGDELTKCCFGSFIFLT